jgi:AcrR family transcriptional regulator
MAKSKSNKTQSGKSNDQGLRALKHEQIYKTIQSQSMKLFLMQGYEQTTVEQIAQASNVSHMTIFRYFPTKEHIVLDTEYTQLIINLLNKQPPNESADKKIESVILGVLTDTYKENKTKLFLRTKLIMEVPSLRSKLWENEQAMINKLAQAFKLNGETAEFKLKVIISLYIQSVSIAMQEWVSKDNVIELPDLIKESFRILHNKI